MDFLIQEAAIGVAGGMNGGEKIAEILLKEKTGQSFYLSLSEVDELPCFYETINSTFKQQLRPDDQSEDFWDGLNDSQLEVGDYEEVYSNTEDDYYLAFKYLTYLVRAEKKTAEAYIKSTKGRWLSTVMIPKTDVEEEYLELVAENGDWDDDEDLM